MRKWMVPSLIRNAIFYTPLLAGTLFIAELYPIETIP